MRKQSKPTALRDNSVFKPRGSQQILEEKLGQGTNLQNKKQLTENEMQKNAADVDLEFIDVEVLVLENKLAQARNLLNRRPPTEKEMRKIATDVCLEFTDVEVLEVAAKQVDETLEKQAAFQCF